MNFRHQGRHEPGPDDAREEPDPRLCSHVWQVRSITYALPGAYVCEVCDCCGTLNIAGPDELAHRPAEEARPIDLPWRHQDHHLVDLAQGWPGGAERRPPFSFQ